ncbi:hypothetical protein BC332_13022 [Capsicum chinense]|nr:hypothetical protein BC332_13022 [Capsicum chinense]
MRQKEEVSVGTMWNFHAVETTSKLPGGLTPLVERNDTMVMKAEVTEVKVETLSNAEQVSPGSTDIAKHNLDDTYTQKSAGDSPGCLVEQENVNIEKDMDQSKQENTSAPSESTTGSKSGKAKIKGVSIR